MDFFNWKQNNDSLSRYLDFCVFMKSTYFKICDVIIGIMEVTLMLISFSILLSTIKIKFDQILVCCITNIYNTFLRLKINAGDWKLVPGPLMTLLKWQYSKIWQFFNRWHLPFLKVLYLPFQKKWNTGILT